jgi:AraC family transcriptional regulator, positive regulator of tynA and feaB
MSSCNNMNPSSHQSDAASAETPDVPSVTSTLRSNRQLPHHAFQFSTGKGPPGSGRARWREALGTFVDLVELTIPDERNFAASLQLVRSPGGLLFANMSAGPSTVAHQFRSPSARSEALVALVCFSGRGTVRQAGRSIDFTTGDIIFRRALQPTEIHCAEPTKSLAIAIPVERFRDTDFPGVPEWPCPFRVGFDQAPGPATHGLLRGLALRFQELDEQYLQHLEHAAIHMLSASARAAHRPRRHGIRPNDRWPAFVAAVERRLREPTLRITNIASDLHCSTRWLQKLLARQQLRFEAYLLERRLELARGEIADPRRARQSITSISLDCGFNDLSHFSRNFRARYGTTAREYRQFMLGVRTSDD